MGDFMHQHPANPVQLPNSPGELGAVLATMGTLLESVVNTLPLAVIALDDTGLVRLWSLGAERMFGYSVAEVIGRPLRTIPQGAEPGAERSRFAGTQRDVQGLRVRRR